MMKLEQLFEGNQTHRGVLGKIVNNKKIAWQESEPFDWEKHLKGDQPQGLSPVNVLTGECRWICLDIDLKIKPEEFCKDIFEKIGHQYFCFKTMGGKWRVVEFLEDWMGVNEAKDRAKQLEAKVQKELNIKCDGGHTLPQSFDLENGLGGGWIFMPYHNENTVCYSPGGFPINKQQCEFRAHYRNYPMIISTVGMIGGGEEGSRRKALWCVLLNMKHDDTLDVSLEELNKNFGVPLDERQLQSDINHISKTTANEKYDKKYFLNGMLGWVEGICGAKPYLDAKSFIAVSTELVDRYIYVRIRGDVFEMDTMTFVEKQNFDDMWAHYSKKFKKPMSKILLEDERMKKVIKYFTHAGKPEGIVEIAEGEVKGLDGGTYLNVYKPSDIVAAQGDITRIDEYFNFAFGEENWLIVKQFISFMLNEPGEKIQWFIIIQGQTQGVGKKLLSQVMQRLFGARNVRPNVAFKDITSGHSTIIDGAQLIILNEVALANNTGKRKELSEEFKALITDDNLMVNPKFKQPIEIPNLTNFWVLSNSDTPVYMDEEDRRACVIQIRRSKEEVKEMLINQGYKKDLKDLYDDPSAFKYHLMNEVKYDRDMFFENAPMNADKREMIEANKGEFIKVMDMKYEASKFPFGNLIRPDAVEMYSFKGMINLDTTFEAMLSNPTFRQSNKMYWGLDELKDYIKSISKPWKEGKEVGTRQIKSVTGYMRVWLIHDYEVKGRKISSMTEGELGAIWDSKLTAEEINRTVALMPNYEEPFSEDKNYDTNCWSCKKPISQTLENTCGECNYAIKCECGQCACDRPGNEHMKSRRENY
jgi:hypothetical protein